MRKKGDLPTKLCPVCNRTFAWRRKWARDWESVRYCSKKCAGVTPLEPSGSATAEPEG